MKKRILCIIALALALLPGCQKQEAPSDYTARGSTQYTSEAAATESEPESRPEPEPDEESAAPSDPWEVSIHSLEEEEREKVTSNDVVEIPEMIFVAQTNDIYLNPQDYFGKTIQYEGFYDIYEDEMSDAVYHYVARNGPGCCANDTLVGFEIFYDGELPQINDWVEVSGKIEILEEESVLILRVDSITKLDTRGKEYVTM